MGVKKLLSANLMLVLLLLQMDVPFLERWIILCVFWGRGCFLLLQNMLWGLQQHVGMGHYALLLLLCCLWFCALSKHQCCRHLSSGQGGLSPSQTSQWGPAQASCVLRPVDVVRSQAISQGLCSWWLQSPPHPGSASCALPCPLLTLAVRERA